jgi:hypothetical protein
MRTTLKSLIFWNSTPCLALLVSLAGPVRAQLSVDPNNVACGPCYTSFDGILGTAPYEDNANIGAACWNGVVDSSFVGAAAGWGLDVVNDYYSASASAEWTSSGVEASATAYSADIYAEGYVDVSANCAGSSSGYSEYSTDTEILDVVGTAEYDPC